MVLVLPLILLDQILLFRDPLSPFWAELDLLVTGTTWGRMWQLQLLSGVLAMVAFWSVRARREPRVSWRFAVATTLFCAVIPALSGHSAGVNQLHVLAVGADALHVISAGAWLGTLAALVGVVRAAVKRGAVASDVLPGAVVAFSPLALLSAGTLVGTGLFATWLHVGSLGGLFGSMYGRILLAKVALVGVAAGLGAYNWRRVTPRLGSSEGRRGVHVGYGAFRNRDGAPGAFSHGHPRRDVAPHGALSLYKPGVGRLLSRTACAYRLTHEMLTFASTIQATDTGRKTVLNSTARPRLQALFVLLPTLFLGLSAQRARAQIAGVANDGFQYETLRSPAMGLRGVVATSQPLAANAGLDILKRGGNAIDAAIATAAVLTLVEPMSTSLGGDAFIMVYIAAEKKLVGINASGRAPYSMTLDALNVRLDQHGMDRIDGIYAVSVPGAVDGWFEVLEAYGTMTMAEVLEPRDLLCRAWLLRLAHHRRRLAGTRAESGTVDEGCTADRRRPSAQGR